ncbi:MAG: phosphate starvation-inducible protein PsiF [Deltaproteobacteria bacterium]|nr:phosphate starvation-inducible protein PsiF [Deltaproteobacteria bacterium]
MKKILFALAGLSLLAAPAFAQTAQQNKMADCNKQATEKGLKGDERKKFMSECLKGGAAAAPAPAPAKPDAPAAPAAGGKKELPPKEAMGACAKKSKELGNKGDAHKKFMSDCLKAKGPDNMK